MTEAFNPFLSLCREQLLLEKITEADHFASIPGLQHPRLVRPVINDVLKRHPEWLPAAAVLISYRMQKWAFEERKRLDLASIADHFQYFGITRMSQMSVQYSNMDDTEKLLEIADEIFYGTSGKLTSKEQAVLKGVHAVSDSTEVSMYLIRTRYCTALEHACSSYNRKIRACTRSLQERQNNLEQDIGYLYHDTEMLLNLFSSKHRLGSISHTAVRNDLNACIQALQTYPLGDDLMCRVIALSAEGYSQTVIGEKLGIVQSYVNQKYKEGIRALSMLLWGFSTKDILDSLV